MQPLTIPMADGTAATYAKGSFNVDYNGTAYLNYEYGKLSPHVFGPNPIAKKTKEGLQVKSGKHTVTLPEAKIVTIPVQEPGSSIAAQNATYLQGSYELQYKGETYTYLGDLPMLRIPEETTALLQDTTVRILLVSGHIVRDIKFEKRSDKLSGKRKILDAKAYCRYEEDEKRTATLQKNAAKALELANRALDAVKELQTFEEAMRTEAETTKEMYEIRECPLSNAEEAIKAMVGSVEDEIGK